MHSYRYIGRGGRGEEKGIILYIQRQKRERDGGRENHNIHVLMREGERRGGGRGEGGGRGKKRQRLKWRGGVNNTLPQMRHEAKR